MFEKIFSKFYLIFFFFLLLPFIFRFIDTLTRLQEKHPVTFEKELKKLPPNDSYNDVIEELKRV